MEGRKYDAGKPRYELVPARALEEVVKVLTFGASKYSDHNWRKVPDAEDRYFGAAQRHCWAHLMGRTIDEESDLPALAHAICGLLFVLELSLEKCEQKAPSHYDWMQPGVRVQFRQAPEETGTVVTGTVVTAPDETDSHRVRMDRTGHVIASLASWWEPAGESSGAV